VDVCVLTVDFHHLEKCTDFFDRSVLVDIDDIVERQNSSTNALDFVDELGKFYLDCHEINRDPVVEIELVWSTAKPFLQDLHGGNFCWQWLPV